ncbi:acyl carrier protein [Pseudomonas gingeri]|uniref:acyl carrier protein n=1 Tax=Pseudomonas gingeri TaxID=117681 RepID=UPI00159FF1F5|nr:acyl carrier protein [Pseudomonas gingeri]NWD75867.1 acyl carrier protein [Pseudomonas gingeri]
MSTQPLETVVLELLATTLELDITELDIQLSIDELGLDSLDVLKLTYAIEKRFQVNLSSYSHTDISSVARLIEILCEQLAGLRVAS